ncbi:MAG: response regulator [Anaerolineae bacterium]
MAQLLGHGERIPLVEDNEQVRQVCMQTLQSAGYEVICAVDGADALEMLDTLTAQVDLVITDMVMPRVGGAELLTQLRARGFDWPALVMAGYPLHQAAEWESLGSPHWIMKPFSLAVLLEKVRAILRGAGGLS